MFVQACCLDFLYFNRHLLEAGLRDLLNHPEEARIVTLLMSAFSDGHRLLSHTFLDSEPTQKVKQLTLVMLEPSYPVWLTSMCMDFARIGNFLGTDCKKKGLSRPLSVRCSIQYVFCLYKTEAPSGTSSSLSIGKV